ncbi:MAG: AI-2E family transporter [Methylobacterium sp.]|uniref:AI-2E family transporter n=1 Tax=unclassified Methylobacterium TaxID=2615210 RepID=UPI0006FC86D4|nr:MULTISPECIES: AI-2E family transporter [unclassified Methylobacterium]KQP03454.1 transporter [Methylobacterium sp. Leaf99]MDO9427347.1 AI-2E family transporter [Methylobacterium sp.]TXM67384.1 AI-2E family transporter [Methylobacterium sp. WL69]
MSDDPITARLLRQAMPVFTTLASCLLVITIAAALYLGRDIFVPVTLAILLSFVLVPAVRLLRRIRVPRALAVMLVVIAAFGALLGIALLIANEAAQLAADLPRYQLTMRDKIASLKEATAGSGTLTRVIDMAQDIGAQLQPEAKDAVAEAAKAGSLDRPLHVQIAAAKVGLLGTLGAFAAPILHPLATTGLILIFTIFILLQREDLRNRAIRLAGSGDLRRTTAAIDDAVSRLSRFFLAQLCLNIAFGFVIGLGLWWIGVPNPILFGVLAAIMRFVPYVGAAISALLPLVVAAAVDPGWTMVIATAALFLVVEPIAGHVIEPLLYGHSTGLSPIAVILAATLWAFLWGPIGLVLATPITVCLVVLGRHIERLWFLDVILGDQPALSPPEIFYQRMLAGDPAEAIDQGELFLKARALVTYYDEVVLAGLLMAQEDLARGALDRARQGEVGTSLRTVVTRLGTRPVRRAKSGRAKTGNSETSAAVAAVGPDRQVAAIVRTQADLAPGWRGPRPVLCVSSRGPFDEAATLMLSQILGQHGLAAQVMSMAALRQGERPEVVEGIAMVCFSYLEPVSLSQIRLNVRQARQAIPGVRVLVGFWRERDPATLERLRRTISADVLVTSLNGALDAALRFSERRPDAVEAPAPAIPRLAGPAVPA